MSYDAMAVALGASQRISQVADDRDYWADEAAKFATRTAELIQVVEKLKAAAAQQELTLKVEQMDNAGLVAQLAFIGGLKTLAHTAFDPSGKFYADGDPKTKGRLIYEAAFDAMGLSLGIANPVAHRAD